jgi:glyoxylase I family protein
MTESQFAHVALVCKNPAAVERFYGKHFGFRRRRVVDLGDGEQIVFTGRGDLMLEIFGAKEDQPIPAPEKDGYGFPGWRHIAFQVPDLGAKLRDMGEDAHITLGPLDFGDFIPGWRSAWVADPEGNIIEISQGYRDQANPPKLD